MLGGRRLRFAGAQEATHPGDVDRRSHGTVPEAGLTNKTTVDQIAAAADVSPRTFSRYFATKDAVYLRCSSDWSTRWPSNSSRSRRRRPARRAPGRHIAVLRPGAVRRVPGLSSDGIALTLRVINATDELRMAAVEFEHDATRSSSPGGMGVDLDDRALRVW